MSDSKFSGNGYNKDYFYGHSKRNSYVSQKPTAKYSNTKEYNSNYNNYKSWNNGGQNWKPKSQSGYYKNYSGHSKGGYGHSNAFKHDSRFNKVNETNEDDPGVSSVIFTKEDQETENKLIQTIMVIATYKAYFWELLSSIENDKENNPVNNFQDFETSLDIRKITSTIFSQLKGLAPAKSLTNDLESMIKSCIEESSKFASESEVEDIQKQIKFYSDEFESTKNELLSLIIKREIADYHKSEQLLGFESYNGEKVKFLTPFRIYRKTLAPKIKELRPNLNGKERQTIIKEEWAKLGNKEKYVYVLKSRWDKERAIYQAKTLELKSKLSMFIQNSSNSTQNFLSNSSRASDSKLGKIV